MQAIIPLIPQFTLQPTPFQPPLQSWDPPTLAPAPQAPSPAVQQPRVEGANPPHEGGSKNLRPILELSYLGTRRAAPSLPELDTLLSDSVDSLRAQLHFVN